MLNWALRAGNYRKFSAGHFLQNHASWNVPCTAYFHANNEIVLAVVVAGIICVNGVNRGIRFVWNLVRDSFLIKLAPLFGDVALPSHFLGIRSPNLNSDDRELRLFNYFRFH